ncbi:hypothetical protein CPLU01_09719 [Colletotrichum plurivorum]|uniref:Uncharacterized protein n=1 Tax=Colletotrichum plurivorum TaxID=2175906 RepID=A0A8H6NAF7_9PEZI|nr:hypothetical protein CPLU01_09719 [Colletotrichum plurivorum]
MMYPVDLASVSTAIRHDLGDERCRGHPRLPAEVRTLRSREALSNTGLPTNEFTNLDAELLRERVMSLARAPQPTSKHVDAGERAEAPLSQ